MHIRKKSIPKKGSQMMAHYDKQYRWIAKATEKGSEILVEYNEISDGQMLIVQLPKVCNLGLLEPAVDFALVNGWKPAECGEHYIIRKNKDTFKIIQG